MEDVGNLQTARLSIKLLDATLRDGGLVNSFYFTDDFVRALYKANIASGVDIMEFGYKCSEKLFDTSKFGKWKFCKEEDIRGIVGNNDSDMKISVMGDVGRVDLENDVIPKKDSVIDLYRIACYVNQVPTAVEMINHCHDMGYMTSCNIMAISKNQESDLRNALEEIGKSPVDMVYIVDSFGALYPEEIRRIANMYLEIINGKYGKQVGIHAHNNQQLAFANEIDALAQGVNYVDGTVNGLGRGAGNCFTEALLGFLKNPRYKLDPMLKFIREYMVPLKKNGLVWGYDVPYLITGLLNVHPYAAIDFIKANRYDYEDWMNHLIGID